MSRKNDANKNDAANRAKLVEQRKALQDKIKVQETESSINTTLAQDEHSAQKSVAEVQDIASVLDAHLAQAEKLIELNHKVATFAVNDTIRFYCMKCHHAVDSQVQEIYTTREGHKRARTICPSGHKATRGHLDVAPKDLTGVTVK